MEMLKYSKRMELIDLFYNDIYGLNIVINLAMKIIGGQQNPIRINIHAFSDCNSNEASIHSSLLISNR
jgi:hypothetical protein